MTRKATVYPQPAVTSHPMVQNNSLQRKHAVSGLSLSGGETAMQFASGLGQDFSQLPVSSTPLPFIQTKLTVGQPNDKYEQEADRVAEQVMRMPAPERVGTQIQRTPLPKIQRACSACEDKKKLQAKEIPGGTPEVTPAVASRIQSLQGGGQPLSTATRNFFEPRFGQDFSNVRVHTDSASTRDLNARAYTVGHNIIFGTGQYAPSIMEGKGLLAHELTHVVQQSQLSSGIKIQRQVSFHTPTFCPGGENAAPEDALAILDKDDARARQMLELAILATDIEQRLVPFGLSGPAREAYERRFGLPPIDGQGLFVNRLTSETSNNINEVITSELSLIAIRLRSFLQALEQPIIYKCSDRSGVFFGIDADCNNVLVTTSPGIGVIIVCPTYWPPTHDDNTRASFLVHESSHMASGNIGDSRLDSPNENFFMADCWERYVGDINNVPVPSVNKEFLCPNR